MIKVSSYLDTTQEKFKGKSELELWMMLTEDLQRWIVINEGAVLVEKFLTDFSAKVGKAAMMVKSFSSTSSPGDPTISKSPNTTKLDITPAAEKS